MRTPLLSLVCASLLLAGCAGTPPPAPSPPSHSRPSSLTPSSTTPSMDGTLSAQIDPIENPALFIGSEVLLTASGTADTLPLPEPDPSSGDAPPEPALSYHWDFGDGQSAVSSAEEAGATTHAYTQAGSYTVTLTVQDPASGRSSTSSVQLNVMPELRDLVPRWLSSGGYDANWKPIPGNTAALGVRFPVPGLRYEWTFQSKGGSEQLTGASVTRTFTTPGLYDVTLNIYDDRPETPAQPDGTRPLLAQESTVTVYDPQPTLPTVSRSASAPDTASLRLSNAASFRSAVWDFGDGQTGTGMTVSHPYARNGVYPVTVTATDLYGREQQATVLVMITTPINASSAFDVPVVSAVYGGASTTSAASLNTLPANREEAGTSLQAQATGDTLDTDYPSVLPPTMQDLLVSQGHGSSPGYLASAARVSVNGEGRARGAGWNLTDCTATGESCMGIRIARNAFPATLPSGTTTLNFQTPVVNGPALSQTVRFHSYAGLRVPHVMVNVLPDTALERGITTDEYAVQNAGREEFFVVVNIPERRVNDLSAYGWGEQVTFEVPVYAVDERGQLMTGLSGLFGARFEGTTLSSSVRNGVMVRGRALMTVTGSLSALSTGTPLDFRSLRVSAPSSAALLTPGQLKHPPNLSTAVALSHERPLSAVVGPVMQGMTAQGLSAQSSYPYPVNLQNFGKLVFGANKAARQAFERAVSLAGSQGTRTVVGLIPVVGDTVDLFEQAYNAASGQNVDKVLVVLAAGGLVFDATTGGVGDITAPLKALYRLGGDVSRETVTALVGILRTGTLNGQPMTARQALNVVKTDAEFLLALTKGIDLRRGMDKALATSLEDALRLAKEAHPGNILEGLNDLSNQYVKFQNGGLFGSTRNVVNRLHTAKYAIFQPTAAKTMGRCGDGCVPEVERLFTEWRAAENYAGASARVDNIFSLCDYSTLAATSRTTWMAAQASASCPAKTLIQQFEQEFGAPGVHALRRHGPGTTLEQQRWRAKTGRLPDDPAGKANKRPSAATRFVSYQEMLDVLQKAKQAIDSGIETSGVIIKLQKSKDGILQGYTVYVDQGKEIAEGYAADNSKVRFSCTTAVVAFSAERKLITSYGIKDVQ